MKSSRWDESITPISQGLWIKVFKEAETKFGNIEAQLKKLEKIGDNVSMKPYSELKHDLFMMAGTALAVAAVVVPLLIWGIDSKLQSIDTKITEMDRRWEQRQVYYDKYIDAKLEKQK